jgi:ligand-binding sensor domain-containing protein
LRLHRPIPACLISLFCYSTSLLAVDPGTHISQYAHTAWRLQDGAFSGTPNAITQTTDGYLWIGTPSGLFRFDGVRFVPVADAKTTSRAVFSLLGGSDGGLWIGTEGYLTHLKDGVLTEFRGNSGRINAIVEDREGKAWFTRSRAGDDQGPLCQVAGPKLSCKGTADGITRPYAGALIKDPAGYFWLGSANLLTRWKAGDSATFVPSGLERAVGVSGIQALAITKDGTIWCGICRRGPGVGLR